MPDDPEVHVETRAQWRQWLVTHHEEYGGAWAVTWRKPTGRPAPSYDDLVEEALCVGWVDSMARVIDDERTSLRFSPRKRGSGWALTNKERVARLSAKRPETRTRRVTKTAELAQRGERAR